MRTVYLGTSAFAVAVLRRLADSPHRPAVVVTRPDRPKGRGRKLAAPPVADAARELGIDLLQPEDLHAPDVLTHIASVEPDVLIVCAYGAMVKDPLLLDYEILNVHPSLLPRWRGAAPIERAIMAGDRETGVAIMRLTAGLDSGPVCLVEREEIRADDDYGTLAARLEVLGGDLLVRALDERPEFVEQDEAGVTYAEKIGPADRSLDPTRPPDDVERVVRALRPHIGARIPLPDGGFLGVWSARVNGATVAAAGGRVYADDLRLLLDCNGGALQLLEVQPPGGRRMGTAEWLRGRPDARHTHFWIDPRLPARSLEDLVACALDEWDQQAEWAPHLAALCWRGDAEVLDAMRGLAGSDDERAQAVAAYVLGQLGIPGRTFPHESATELRRMADREGVVTAVLEAIAHAFGNLGDPHGTDVLLRLRTHPDPAVRGGVAQALAGRTGSLVTEALVALSADEDGEVRDWATFALGALVTQDTPDVREALAARLEDSDQDARLEAVHGLALRGDPRAIEPALDLLEVCSKGEQDVWRLHALEATAIVLAALSGDERFREYLPEPDERWKGTDLGRQLVRAIERTTGDITA